MKKSEKIWFFSGLLAAAVLSFFIFGRKVRYNLRFFWTSGYYYIVYIALITGFIYIIFRKNEIVKSSIQKLKYSAFFIFLPFALIPVIRCYFRIPYIFCRVCPRKCPWGELRPFIIPAFLVQNLDNRFWCFKLCPFGTLQDYQCRISKKRIFLPKWAKSIRYFFLAFAIFVVLALIFHLWNIKAGFFYRGSFDVVVPAIIAAAVIFILAFFIPRFWCNYFCPVGSFGDLMLRIENRIK